MLGDNVWLQFILKVLDNVKTLVKFFLTKLGNNFFMELALCTGASSIKVAGALRSFFIGTKWPKPKVYKRMKTHAYYIWLHSFLNIVRNTSDKERRKLLCI